MKSIQRPQLVLSVCAVLALGACGGGSGVAEKAGTPPAVASGTVPDPVMANALRFIRDQQALGASDTIESQTLQKLLAPLNDTAEPTPVDGG